MKPTKRTTKSPAPTPANKPVVATKPVAPAVTAPPKPAPAPAPAPAGVNIVFSLQAPQAKEVSVYGDFDGWKPFGTPLRRQDGGRWQTAIPLKPGRYQYKFTVDGKWVTDPAARETVADGHGSMNAVIVVPA